MMKKNFDTAFVLAADKGDDKEVKRQYETTSTLPTKNEQCYFAMYFASFNGHERIVKFLLSKKVDPNFTVGLYLTPLHAAILKKQESIVKILLSHGANVNPKIKLESGEEADHIFSPLICAVYVKNEKLVNTLLKKGANVNMKIQCQNEAKLKQAIKSAHSSTPAVRRKNYLSYGTFSPSNLAKNRYGVNKFTALHFALKFKNEDMVKMLLDHGADPNSRSGADFTPLYFACTKNNLPLVKLLLKAGADLKAEVNHGKQLLSCILQDMVEECSGDGDYQGYCKAEWVRKNKLFSYLLKIGADPNGWSTGKKGSILHYAASKGMANAVHLLLKHGANVNSVNGDGKTPFEYAVNHLQKLLTEIQDYFSNTVDLDLDEEQEEERRKREFENRKIYNLTHNTYTFNLLQYKYHYEDDGGYVLFRDPDPYRIISQLMTRELVRLETLGTRNVQQNVKLLETTFVKPYYTRCKNELKKLKKTEISDSVNYYDFLFANDSKLDEIVGNEKIMSSIDKKECRKLFPNYSRFLRLKVKRGLKRKNPDFDQESNGSSDDDIGKGSVQMRGTIKKRWMRAEDFFNYQF